MQTVVLFSTVLINIKWVINHNDFIKSSYVRHSLYAQLPLQVSAKCQPRAVTYCLESLMIFKHG